MLRQEANQYTVQGGGNQFALAAQLDDEGT
jgi:hypothetical protein